MRSKGLYLITPKQELLNIAKNMDEDIRGIFTDEVIFSGNESDRSNWSKEDYIARAKLSFLIELSSEYSDIDEYKLLFEAKKMSINVFDSWWEIKRYEISADVEEIDQIEASKISFTGNEKVDKWLASKTS